MEKQTEKSEAFKITTTKAEEAIKADNEAAERRVLEALSRVIHTLELRQMSLPYLRENIAIREAQAANFNTVPNQSGRRA